MFDRYENDLPIPSDFGSPASFVLSAQGVWTAHNRLELLEEEERGSVRKLPHLQKKYFAQPGPFFAQCQQQTQRERGGGPPEGQVSAG